MEYPDKVNNPQEYIAERFKEMNRKNLSQEERELICGLAKEADYLSENLEGYDIENVHLYVIDAFDMVCDLIKNKNCKYHPQIIRDIIKDSEKVLLGLCEIEERMMKIMENTNDLERKIMLGEITAEMRSVN